MSYLQAPYYKSRGGLAYFDGEFITGTRDIGGFTTAGATPEIDITTLISPRREFVPGLPDGGGSSMSIVASMNSDIYYKFQESNDEQLTRKLDIFFGGMPAADSATGFGTDERRTNGSAVMVEKNQVMLVKKGNPTGSTGDARGSAHQDEWIIGDVPTGAPSATANSISCEKDHADGIPNGVTVGDFVEFTVGSNVKYYRIHAIEEVAGDRVAFRLTKEGTGSDAGKHVQGPFTAADFYSSSPALGANNSVQIKFNIVRPAVRFSIPVYIADFQHSTGAGGLIEMQVAYRITGKGDLFVGDKKISSAVKPFSPKLSLPSFFWTTSN